MKVSTSLIGFAIAGLLSGQAHAASYNFNVTYSGGGNATLNAGSDNPIGTTLLDGDSFSWNIQAFGDFYWNVVTAGGFFPLMAFALEETGNRIGSFELALSNNGTNVFNRSETDALQSYVHMGTNTVELESGLKFDEMHLTYTLTSAMEAPDFAIDPGNLQPIGSTPQGLLPIFGAPEMNPYYPGIEYVNAVPEPETYALMMAGLAGVGWASRRRKLQPNA